MKKLLNYIAFLILVTSLLSCGPKRLGCGPGRCDVEQLPNILKQKNPETIISGLV
ncbi:hypothetical protein [Flavobacterium orientale]|uniref:hypothetical protein n=1 Tax=Flavobacterium orientale TaxID=1756020 RepID=UPI00166D3E69|nr:hypothetical protein [Flavobacterium orientale]